MKRYITEVLSLILMLSTMFSFTGCGINVQNGDLMKGIKANNVSGDIKMIKDDPGTISDFAVQLFQKSMSTDSNTLISPVSVLSALAMTANGAAGETLAQMEDVFGMPVNKLNEYLHAYKESLPSDKKYKVSLANSIWFKDNESLKVNQDFLQKNADYYGASINKAAFGQKTLKDINDWVSRNTAGMIKNILDKIPAEAVMYLINALAFDAEWQTVYKEDQVRDGIFTSGSGEKRNVEMLHGTENMFLEDNSATGFIKYYADRKYAFAALLPKEGVSISDYVRSLSGDGLMKTLENARGIQVNAVIPKFKSDYSLEMKDILASMGMSHAFDPTLADFKNLANSADGNIYISRVIHKTHIAVDEKGTKAGAATVVEMRTGSAMLEPEDVKTVILDHPFVYMIVDCETNLPLFIGTVMDIPAD